MFQVIIPHTAERRTSQDVGELVRVGLGDLVDGAGVTAVAETPTEYGGFLWYWPRPGAAPRFGYAPERQTWVPALEWDGCEAGRYWIGFDNDQPLGPEQLKRRRQEPGTWVIAGDGNRWCLPSVETLPRDYVPCNGGWGRVLPERYNQLAMDASEMMFRFQDDATPIPLQDCLTYVMKFLRLNYRMTPEVMARLRLLNAANAEAIFLAALHPKLEGAARA